MKTYLKDYFFIERLCYGLVLIVGDLLVFTIFYGNNALRPGSVLGIWLVASALIYFKQLRDIKSAFSAENHQIQLITLKFEPRQTLNCFKQILIKDLIQITFVRIVLMLVLRQYALKVWMLVLFCSVLNAVVILRTKPGEY